ncbi:uncharacterized protein MONOS_10019 [Monocercomonoides exilis]|uniref:uncharacterized protein n=1 Tax=Monocercomonoides exilis TaxID=2049356 RepID=UPI00355A49AA|nr:hypothetical protein MONOS_10019 [Monocercomonoides exilis]|eukprot:MONOS_10019.1-p1 / transcript=MONOS_10019.1 / gene=MONOS_10019 / organism=Monocercomonoides_exilis_PA203 / gene_product=unspecified product / transcript_product=unspecified product / location=Mono_scaffold00437:37421-38840(-) / protein_length=249 / sequence_SO=supercontig / SO=protein_coding / is_pseudo=false
MMSGLTEQLQEKDKIIWMQQRKILELSEKHNAEVKELKELQEQLMEMKEKNELSDVVIMKEKSRTQHDEVVSGQRGHAGDVGVVACHVYSVSFRLREKNQEKFSTSIGDDSVVMLGPNPSLKELSVKVESLASAAREANSGDGGGDGCEGTKLETSRRLEKNGIGTNGSGGGSIGGLSVAGGAPLPNGKTEMKRLMSTASGVLGQVAFKTVHVLRMPPILRLSVQMERLKTGLQPSLVWTLSMIRGIY